MRADDKLYFFSATFVFFISLFVAIAPVAPKPLAVVPLLLLIIFYVWHRAISKEKLTIPFGGVICYAVVLGLSFLSYLWAFDPDVTIEKVIKQCLVLIPGFLLLCLAGAIPRHSVKPYFWLVPASIFLCVMITAGELFFELPIYRVLHNVADGQLHYLYQLNRGSVISFLLSGIVLVVIVTSSHLKEGWPIIRRLMITVVLGCLGVIFWETESQSAQLAFIAMAITFFLFPYRNKAAWIALVSLTFIGFLLMPWIVVWMNENILVWAQENPWILRGSPEMRLHIWTIFSGYIEQKPFYGYGVEAARAVAKLDPSLASKRVLHPHNFVIQLWLEFGVWGAVMGFGVISYLLKIIYCKYVGLQQRVALSALVGWLVVSLTAFGLWQGWWLGFTVLLMVVLKFCMDYLEDIGVQASESIA